MGNAVPIRSTEAFDEAQPSHARGTHEKATELAPVEAVFEHWIVMHGLNRNRCALGPARRKAVERALALYDVDTLMLAVEGCASSRWHAGDNDRGRAYNDLSLILRDEEHVERFAQMGEALREAVARAGRAAPVIPIAPSDPAAVLAQRAELAAMAKRIRGGSR